MKNAIKSHDHANYYAHRTTHFSGCHSSQKPTETMWLTNHNMKSMNQ